MPMAPKIHKRHNEFFNNLCLIKEELLKMVAGGACDEAERGLKREIGRRYNRGVAKNL